MTVSAEQFQKIAEIAGLQINSNDSGKVTQLTSDRITLTVEDNLGLEPVLRLEMTPEGVVAEEAFEDQSNRQWIHVDLAPTGTTPHVMLSLEDATARFLPEGSERPDAETAPTRIVLTDLKRRAVVFDRNKKTISVRSTPTQ